MQRLKRLPTLAEVTTSDALWDAVEATGADPAMPWFNGAHEAIDRWASEEEAERDRPAIVFRTEDGGRDVWSYQRLSEASKKLAEAFAASGLQRGDRIGGILTKQPESYLTALAAWRSGMIYVPMFVGLGSDGLVHRSRAGDVKAIVVDAAQRLHHPALGDPRAASLRPLRLRSRRRRRALRRRRSGVVVRPVHHRVRRARHGASHRHRARQLRSGEVARGDGGGEGDLHGRGAERAPSPGRRQRRCRGSCRPRCATRPAAGSRSTRPS